ncbi:hypothetical protein O0L34_g17327 [Tuta absoluta]|nr:hypothetical protein O0L34_g17327 [Tuta absoluta]
MASYQLCLLILSSIINLNLAKPADSDLPPLDCPENEVYKKCALEQCFNVCFDLVSYPACPMLTPDCVLQACVCKSDYLRNTQGVCIPKHQCPEWEWIMQNNDQGTP